MERKTKKYAKLTEEFVTDSSSGEVKYSIKTKEGYSEQEPPYIKMYLEFLLEFKNLPSSMNSVLLALLKRMNYQNEIVINRTVKIRIADELGITEKSISNNLYQLAKSQILIRQGQGFYVVNALLFGKGQWKDIYKIREIQAKMIFNESGKTIESLTITGDEDEENGSHSQDIAS